MTAQKQQRIWRIYFPFKISKAIVCNGYSTRLVDHAVQFFRESAVAVFRERRKARGGQSACTNSLSLIGVGVGFEHMLMDSVAPNEFWLPMLFFGVSLAFGRVAVLRFLVDAAAVAAASVL